MKQAPSESLARAKLAKTRLPVRFESNAGQMDDRIRFVARAHGSALMLTDDGARMSLVKKEKAAGKHTKPTHAAIALKVDGARTVTPIAKTENQLAVSTNYFIGKNPAKWRANVPTFTKVTYPQIKDGVDLVYHGENGYLEYDFVVAPGANVESVAINVEGADVEVTKKGDLAIHTKAGDIVQPRPVTYQVGPDGKRTLIASSYRLVPGEKRVGFKVAAYDKSRPLVIDPPIPGFATYLGGSNGDNLVGDDASSGVATDATGNTYVTGQTVSIDFPLMNPADDVIDDCDDGCYSMEAFVSKLNPTGTALVYSTYLGGGDTDIGFSVAVDSMNRAYVAGATNSVNFPIFPVPQDPPLPNQVINPFYAGGGFDGFVTRLDASGQLANDAYSTYLAGNGEDRAQGIAVSSTFVAYVTGATNSGELTNPPQRGLPPSQAGTSQPMPLDAFVLALNDTGTALVVGTTDPITRVRHVGGSGDDEAFGIARDANGNVYIAGYTQSPTITAGLAGHPCNGGGQSFFHNAMVARLSGADLSVTWSACVGGTDVDNGYGIATFGNNVYVTGGTRSADFATTPGAFQTGQQPPVVGEPRGDEDAFVTVLPSDGGAFVYSTRFGRAGQDVGFAIAVDSSGSAWITGSTTSSDITEVNSPTNLGFAGGIGKGGNRDAYIVRFNPTGTGAGLVSYLGGDGSDQGTGLAIRGTSIHLLGTTESNAAGISTSNPRGLPASPGAFQQDNAYHLPNAQNSARSQDAFVARFDVPPLFISPPSTVVNVGGTQQFAATGGIGGPYTYSITSNNSNASINPTTGLYSAGAIGNVVDTVTVADAAGITASATVQVGAPPPDLVIAPVGASVPPRGRVNFAASGGTPPYGWVIASNPSGGTIAQNGAYTAGSTGSVVDIVRVTDQQGISRTATVQVGAPLRISPPLPQTPPNGQIAFTATGGSGSGYVWSISKNESGGTIVAGTGVYKAGGVTNKVDTVTVTDGLGNKASVNVSVGGGIAISPAEPTTTTRGTISFTAVGGSGSFTWSIVTAASGGTIDVATGVYTAGSVGNVVDVVKATDSVGNSATVGVNVGPALTIDPPNATVQTGTKQGFAAAGGSGVYVWSLLQDQSGGNIGADGIYTSGPNAGIDIVRLTDSLGSTADAPVTVQARPTTAQPNGTPGVDGGTFNGINIGGGGGDDCSCHTVGTNGHGTMLPRLMAGIALVLGFLVRRRRRS